MIIISLKTFRYILITLFILAVIFTKSCYAEAGEIDNNKLANAIYKAEGGSKATWLYGIRSVKYKNKAEAHQICLNTIRNQRRRHSKHDCGKTYLVCLRDRYCPLQAKNDPLGLNSHWLKNVKYFLNH